MLDQHLLLGGSWVLCRRGSTGLRASEQVNNGPMSLTSSRALSSLEQCAWGPGRWTRQWRGWHVLVPYAAIIRHCSGWSHCARDVARPRAAWAPQFWAGWQTVSLADQPASSGLLPFGQAGRQRLGRARRGRPVSSRRRPPSRWLAGPWPSALVLSPVQQNPSPSPSGRARPPPLPPLVLSIHYRYPSALTSHNAPHRTAHTRPSPTDNTLSALAIACT
ncbi:hypothetical protein SUNI508_08717 [Seiridium unicorne]|uniref:Uncharacterized protein n=1 Tax=Seiridium unicorne TaxID=138068 RepID=A0ABR2UTE0_9PEZI